MNIYRQATIKASADESRPAMFLVLKETDEGAPVIEEVCTTSVEARATALAYVKFDPEGVDGLPAKIVKTKKGDAEVEATEAE